jgi:hypothetical protein
LFNVEIDRPTVIAPFAAGADAALAPASADVAGPSFEHATRPAISVLAHSAAKSFENRGETGFCIVFLFFLVW